MNRIARTLFNVMRIEVLLGIGLVMWVFSLEASADTYDCSFEETDKKLIFEIDPNDKFGEITAIYFRADGSREVVKGYGSELHGNLVFYIRSSSAAEPKGFAQERLYFTEVYSLKNGSELNGFITVDKLGMVGLDNEGSCTRR